MARAPGIYKTEVETARKQLLAQGRHPSVDAVRAALGHTGSKTTIHRYLREIEAVETVAQKPVSESLQALIAPLADQLEREARAELEAARGVFQSEREASRAALEAERGRAAALAAEVERLQAALRNSESRGRTLETQLGAEHQTRLQLEEQAQGLNARLADSESHRRTLENLHEHARTALEHFRQAAKEQRDQETCRHEEQVQQLQGEIRALNGTLTEKRTELSLPLFSGYRR